MFVVGLGRREEDGSTGVGCGCGPVPGPAAVPSPVVWPRSVLSPPAVPSDEPLQPLLCDAHSPRGIGGRG